MLGTILKPSARFNAVRTVLKPSGPFQSRRDDFEAIVAKICRFKAVWPAGFATGHTQYVCVYARIVAPSNFEGAYSKKGRVSELYHVLKQYELTEKWACIPQSRSYHSLHEKWACNGPRTVSIRLRMRIRANHLTSKVRTARKAEFQSFTTYKEAW